MHRLYLFCFNHVVVTIPPLAQRRRNLHVFFF